MSFTACRASKGKPGQHDETLQAWRSLSFDRGMRDQQWSSRCGPVTTILAVAAVHCNAVQQHAAGLRHGSGKRREFPADTSDLCQRTAGERNLSGVTRGWRQRILRPPRPALPAISPWPPHRLEGRLGPQLDVAVATNQILDCQRTRQPRHSPNSRSMEIPWDTLSS